MMGNHSCRERLLASSLPLLSNSSSRRVLPNVNCAVVFCVRSHFERATTLEASCAKVGGVSGWLLSPAPAVPMTNDEIRMTKNHSSS